MKTLNKILTGAKNILRKPITYLALVGIVYGTGCNQEKPKETTLLESPLEQIADTTKELSQIADTTNELSQIKDTTKELSQLEKYNKENAKLYSDFTKFCNENPKKVEYAKSQYRLKLPNSKCNVDFHNKLPFSSLITTDTIFWDNGKGGLDIEYFDGIGYTNKNNGLGESKFIKELSEENQLKVAKSYNNKLKNIMHQEGVPGY